MFKRPFDFDYFSKSIDSNIARDRETDYNYRIKQLLYFSGQSTFITVCKLVAQVPVIHYVVKLSLIF